MCQICAKNSAVSKPEEAKPSLGQKFLGTAEALEAAWAQKTIKPTVFLAPGTAWGPKNYKTHCFGTPGSSPGPTGSGYFGAVRPVPFWGRPRKAEALETARGQKTIKPTVLAPIWTKKNHKTHCFGTNLGPKSIPGAVPDATGRRPGATGRRPGSTGSDGDALLVSDNHCTGDLGGFWLRPGAASAS